MSNISVDNVLEKLMARLKVLNKYDNDSYHLKSKEIIKIGRPIATKQSVENITVNALICKSSRYPELKRLRYKLNS